MDDRPLQPQDLRAQCCDLNDIATLCPTCRITVLAHLCYDRRWTAEPTEDGYRLRSPRGREMWRLWGTQSEVAAALLDRIESWERECRTRECPRHRDPAVYAEQLRKAEANLATARMVML